MPLEEESDAITYPATPTGVALIHDEENHDIRQHDYENTNQDETSSPETDNSNLQQNSVPELLAVTPSTSLGPSENSLTRPSKWQLLKRFFMQSSSRSPALLEESQNHYNEIKRMRLEEQANASSLTMGPTSSADAEEEDAGDSAASYGTCDDDDSSSSSSSSSSSHYISTVSSSDDHNLRERVDNQAHLVSDETRAATPTDDVDSGRGSEPPVALPEEPDDITGLLRLRNGNYTVSFLDGHSDIILSICGSDNLAVSASRDTTVKVWDLFTHEEKANLGGHMGSVKCVKLFSDEASSALATCLGIADAGCLVVSGSEDSSIRIWSLAKGTEVKSVYVFTSVTSIGVLENNARYVVIGTGGGKLELWDIVEGINKHSQKQAEEDIVCIKVESEYVCAGSTDTLCIYKLHAGRLEPHWNVNNIQWPNRQPPTCLTTSAFELHEDKIYVGSLGDIYVVNWKSGNENDRVVRVNNALKPWQITTGIALKEDVLVACSFDPDSKRSKINVFRLPRVDYVGTVCFDEVDRILAITISKNMEGILQVLSGGPKLAMWNITPLSFENSHTSPTEGMLRVKYVSEMETTEHSELNDVDELSQSSISPAWTSSKWRCCIS